MNLTPNSFSDGNQLSTESAIQAKLRHFKECCVDIVDIGFESTAPMNSSLTLSQELERLNYFFKYNLSELLLFSQISLDTYRTEVLEIFIQELLNLGYKGRFVWNDISGQLDGEAIKMLEKYSELDYVYCHNFSPARTTGADHMKFVVEGNLDLKANFEAAVEHFKSFDNSRVLFDPCFGFAKHPSQNLQLLNDLPELIQSLGAKRKWVLGFSRKSFMRSFIGDLAPNLTREEALSYSEYFHVLVLTLFKNIANSLIFRVHDPLTVMVSDKFLHSFSKAQKHQ